MKRARAEEPDAGRLADIREVLGKTLRRELTVTEASRITGVAEREIIAWMRARPTTRAGFGAHRRKRIQAKPSPQVKYAVELYRQRYRHLSAHEFARVLRSEHDIQIRGPGLYVALRREGLVAPCPTKAWRLAAAGIMPEQPANEVVTTVQEAPVDSIQRLGRELQALTDRVERLNARARDSIVQWRRGAGTIEAAISAVGALKAFIAALPE